MLVLSRKIGERILIEPDIEIVVVDVRRGKVRIGIEAPQCSRILRDEISASPRSNLPVPGKPAKSRKAADLQPCKPCRAPK